MALSISFTVITAKLPLKVLSRPRADSFIFFFPRPVPNYPGPQPPEHADDRPSLPPEFVPASPRLRRSADRSRHPSSGIEPSPVVFDRPLPSGRSELSKVSGQPCSLFEPTSLGLVLCLYLAIHDPGRRATLQQLDPLQSLHSPSLPFSS